jgi:SlyX protein
MTELSTRVDELEVKVAHQDMTIDELNATVTAQWKAIDDLTETVTRLMQEVRNIGNAAGAPSTPEPPPPHY